MSDIALGAEEDTPAHMFTSYLLAHLSPDIRAKRIQRLQLSDIGELIAQHVWSLYAASSLMGGSEDDNRVDPANWKGSEVTIGNEELEMVKAYTGILGEIGTKVEAHRDYFVEACGRQPVSLTDGLRSYLTEGAERTERAVDRLVRERKMHDALLILSARKSTLASLKSLFLLKKSLIPTVSRLAKQVRRGRESWTGASDTWEQAMGDLSEKRSELGHTLERFATEVDTLQPLLGSQVDHLHKLIAKHNLENDLRQYRLRTFLGKDTGDHLQYFSLGELQHLGRLTSMRSSSAGESAASSAEEPKMNAINTATDNLTSDSPGKTSNTCPSPDEEGDDSDSSGAPILTPTSSVDSADDGGASPPNMPADAPRDLVGHSRSHWPQRSVTVPPEVTSPYVDAPAQSAETPQALRRVQSMLWCELRRDGHAHDPSIPPDKEYIFDPPDRTTDQPGAYSSAVKSAFAIPVRGHPKHPVHRRTQSMSEGQSEG